MNNETLQKFDELMESFNEQNGNKLSWVTVTVKGAKLTLLSADYSCLDLYDLVEKMD